MRGRIDPRRLRSDGWGPTEAVVPAVCERRSAMTSHNPSVRSAPRSSDGTYAGFNTAIGTVTYDRQDHRAWIQSEFALDLDELR